MAILHPFRAVRPLSEKAGAVACVPYDVINTEEARALAEGNPVSFLHVIRPEIDLPEEIDEHAEVVYDKGAENLRKFVEAGYTMQEDRPLVYVYRLVMNGRPQTGIFGCVSVEEYDDDTILKHELTRPDKEDDRTRHILTQQAHAEPVMLTFRDDAEVNRIMEAVTAMPPMFDFTAPDGIRHTVWQVADTGQLVDAFGGVERLYVADGHHRCKAASRAAEEMQRLEGGGKEAEYGFFPAVLFPMSQMQILPYNRIVRKLPTTPSAFLKHLSEQAEVHENVEGPVPQEPGAIRFYLDGSWYGAVLPPSESDSPVDQLDVARLNEFVLRPVLGIQDPRTDKNLDFVGGIRGTAELERLVNSGKAELGISMYPTSIQELIDVSDAGMLMPPKSTWFEPKLRSGLLVHLF
ncbi:MAG TPA: DUF1015 family protein [Rhodothermales bacterium]|nr:DUF1015 family protein [Rhodothermales bacterium]